MAKRKNTGKTEQVPPANADSEVFIRFERDVAAHLLIDERTWRRWKKEWIKPAWKTPAGWDIAAIVAERDALGLVGSESNELRKETLAKRELEGFKQDQLKTRRLEREEQIELGNLLPRDVYEIFANETIAEARDAFLHIPTEMRKHLPKKYCNDIVEELTKQINTALNRLAKLPAGPAKNDR